MSLKAGAKRSAARVSFLDSFVEAKQQAGKWETCFSFSTFPRLAGAVGMWESRERFPRAVGNEGNMGLVFLVFHGPSFPQPSPVSRATPMAQTSEQLAFRFLHFRSGLGVRLRCRAVRQLIRR